MAENRYWFARRFPLTDPRNSMSPVSPEGYRVAWTFVWWMIGGAVGMIVLLGLAAWAATLTTFGPLSWMLGVVGFAVFIGCTVYGAWYFIREAKNRGDHQHTIDDYKQGRV